MTITREHLELAALAAGMTPVRMSDDGRGLLVAEQSEPWRPHADIADAARLAVRLMMWVDVIGRSVNAQIAGGAISCVDHDGTEPDKIRAWCEAVTLCAAEVGRKMRGGEA